MIDYIAATKYKGKDSVNLSYCKAAASYNSGWDKYYLEGCEKLEVWQHPEGLLKVQGSLPYFLQGHNLCFNRHDFLQAVDFMQSLLGTSLWDSQITAFEYGAVFQVDKKPRQYIARHNASRRTGLLMNEKPQDRGSMRWWENSAEALKLYDAGKNMMLKTGANRRATIAAAGFNPEDYYMKFEAHYKKPALLKGGSSLLLEDLQSLDMLRFLNQQLIEQYQLLDKMKSIELPTSKKDLSSLDILLRAFVESYINVQNQPIEGAKKAIFDAIRQLPDELLTKADKDARRRQISAAFAGLKEAQESPWDLSAELAAALDAEAQEWPSFEPEISPLSHG